MSCGELGKGAKTEHTPEPLHYMPLPAADGTFMVLRGQGQDYGLVASCTTEEDARRIVACVNACAGLSTEFLEQIDSIQAALTGQLVVTEVLENQRDELLAAAEAIEIDAEECLDFDECTAMLVPVDTYHKLMEAIASVKGGAA